jgi:hypothetical protein
MRIHGRIAGSVFFGEDWKAVTPAVGGIEENIPLSWNKKIKVERYESN